MGHRTRTSDLQLARLRGAALCLLACSLPSVASGQHVNELFPRPGESRANKHQYLSSHNSYQRPVSIHDQLDHWNVWEIELDVRWNVECFGSDDFYVLNYCYDPLGGNDWLNNYLGEIAGTQRMQEGFFFLNLELADGPYFQPCLGGCLSATVPYFPSDYMVQLEGRMLAYFGLDAIYTWQDFVTDNYAWPSPQELIRRGKHVAINVNDVDGNSLNTIFFRRSPACCNTNYSDNTAFWNTENWSLQPNLSGDRFLARSWPVTGYLPAYCAIEDKSKTWTAYHNGFNFPNTNCVRDFAQDPNFLVHPPEPMIVVPTTPSSIQLGTWGAPYAEGQGLVNACDRVDAYNAHVVTPSTSPRLHPSTTTILLNPGPAGTTYTVSAAGGELKGPVILTRQPGPSSNPVVLN